jgi:hypothetical protein
LCWILSCCRQFNYVSRSNFLYNNCLDISSFIYIIHLTNVTLVHSSHISSWFLQINYIFTCVFHEVIEKQFSYLRYVYFLRQCVPNFIKISIVIERSFRLERCVIGHVFFSSLQNISILSVTVHCTLNLLVYLCDTLLELEVTQWKLKIKWYTMVEQNAFAHFAFTYLIIW